MRVRPPAPALATERARALRQSQTPAESRLWAALRNRGLGGARSKRQVPFGPYILDFAIPEARIAIELDGDTHATPEAIARDERRDAFMRGLGWRVFRFTNTEVAANLDGVLQVLASALGPGPHPDPLPQAGEGV